MVRNDGKGNWWHNGSLPGTTTIMVHGDGFVLGGVDEYTHEPSKEINDALDAMTWEMVRQVPAWGA
jgi:hypothetical protein